MARAIIASVSLEAIAFWAVIDAVGGLKASQAAFFTL
jgi:hypothetical protein